MKEQQNPLQNWKTKSCYGLHQRLNAGVNRFNYLSVVAGAHLKQSRFLYTITD